jgi:HK97 family phage prohead protease
VTDQQIRYRSVKMRATADSDPRGVFEALGAAYGVTYDVFDWWMGPSKERLAPGVFAKSIAEKFTIPVFWQHGWEQAAIGHGAASETDNALKLNGQFYLDDPMVSRVYQSVVSGAVDEWSIGWILQDSHKEKEDGIDVEVAERGQLVELSSVVMGANPGTQTISVRSAADLLRLRRVLPRAIRHRQDTDEDPGALAQAVDAAIDEALEVIDENPDQAKALLQAAEVSSDALLALLGVDDLESRARGLSAKEAKRVLQLRAKDLISEDDAVKLMTRKGVE